jgi:hypothetical protein
MVGWHGRVARSRCWRPEAQGIWRLSFCLAWVWVHLHFCHACGWVRGRGKGGRLMVATTNRCPPLPRPLTVALLCSPKNTANRIPNGDRRARALPHGPCCMLHAACRMPHAALQLEVLGIEALVHPGSRGKGICRATICGSRHEELGISPSRAAIAKASPSSDSKGLTKQRNDHDGPAQCERIFARSRAIDWLCSWQMRDSVTSSTAAISFRFMSCS